MHPRRRYSRHFQHRDQQRDDWHILDEIRMRADRAAQLDVLAVAEQDKIVPAQPRRLERQHRIDQGKDREIKAGDGWRVHSDPPKKSSVIPGRGEASSPESITTIVSM